MSDNAKQQDVITKIKKIEVIVSRTRDSEGFITKDFSVADIPIEDLEYLNEETSVTLTLNGKEYNSGLINALDKKDGQYELVKMTKRNLITQLLNSNTEDDYLNYFEKNGFLVNIADYASHSEFNYDNVMRILELIKTIALTQNELAKNRSPREYVDYDELLRLFINFSDFPGVELISRSGCDEQKVVINPRSDMFSILSSGDIFINEDELCVHYVDKVYRYDLEVYRYDLENNITTFVDSVLHFYKTIVEEYANKLDDLYIRALHSDDLSLSVKKQLVILCKGFCQYYINEGIKYIYPEIDLEAGTVKMVLPNLFSALFYSLAFFDYDKYRYKRCEAPSCNKYFISSVSRPSRGCCKAHISTISSKDYYNNPEHNKSKKK